MFDIFRGQAILFGGIGNNIFGDIWTYDGNTSTWTQQMPSVPLAPRYGVRGALDQASQQMVVFGGSSPGGLGGIPRGELWAWDGVRWHDAWVDPRIRAGAAMADDPIGGGVLLFGGDDGRGNVLADTQRFDGTQWHDLKPVSAPGGRKLGAMALDPVRHRVVLFGGFDGNGNLGDTWEWDGTRWIQTTPAQSPSARQAHAMAWDEVGQRVLLFGGLDTGVLNDTWAWNGTNWTRLSPTTVPPARARHGMASAPERGRVVMFGGVGTMFLNDTWEWQGSNWVQMQPAVSPAPRRAFAMADDPRRGLTVIQGGADASGRRNDTWEWDGSNWSMRPSTDPSMREGHAMAFDSTHGRLVAFGGENSPLVLSDSWSYGSAADASYVPFGAGCSGPGGAPVLAADGYSLPWLGTSFTARASNLPSTVAGLMYTGFSRTSWGGNPLPFDLSILGMTGCPLLVSADVPFPLTATPPGAATWTLPIPNTPSLAGVEFFNQAIVLDLAANPLGLTVTNGVTGRIGVR